MEDTTWRYHTCSLVLGRVHRWQCSGHSLVEENCIFYLGEDEIGKLQYHQMWLPYAMMPARDVTLVSGGLSALTSALLRHFHVQQVHGVRVLGNHYKLNLKAYVGNYDSIVRMYMAKGASGLRPCLLCANICSSRSDVPFHDPHFLTIQSHDTEKFQPIVPAELHSLFDEVLVACQSKSKKGILDIPCTHIAC